MASKLKQSKTSSDNERTTEGNPRTGRRGMYSCISELGNMNETNIALFSFSNKEKAHCLQILV